MAARRSRTADIQASAPVNVFLKPVSINYKDLFKAVAKGIGHFSLGKWEEVSIDVIEALASIGLTTEPSELAYLLIKRSAISAILELVSDTAPHLSDLLPNDGAAKDADLLLSFEDQPISVGPTFFNNPGESDFVRQIAANLKLWLSNFPGMDSSASLVAERYSSYFVFALNNEWRKNAKSYASLKEALDTPFSRASAKESGWLLYQAMLQKRIQEPSFDEAFSLAQIFIQPYAYIHVKPEQGDIEVGLRHRPMTDRRLVVQLQAELSNWLSTSRNDDTIRIISGGPGSGKSSFARVYAADLAEEGRCRVLFVPLHLIDPAKDLIEEVGRFVKEEGFLVHNPLDPDNADNELLIIFDGLDEIASMGKAAAEAARLFIREVERVTQRRNMDVIRLRVIISGRELVVQENQSDFRREGQIATLLPYHLPREERQQHGVEFIDDSKLLGVDLRDAWWVNYGRLTGKNYAGLPPELNRNDLEEITAQPLLNYLVALSYTRGEIDFTQDITLNKIYADLVSAVYDRGYEKRRTFGPIRHMSVDQFIRVLEEIGLAAWHGDGRTTSVAEIEEHCRSSGVGNLLDLFQDGAKAGVTRLLAAFFFRKQGERRSGDATFVFTHKSFGEYLAARRISRAVDKTVRDLIARAQSPDEGKDEREALRYWLQVCGPTAITSYIHSFLVSEIAQYSNLEQAQSFLCDLFSYALRNGLPVEGLNLSSSRLIYSQVRNAEEALLVAINAMARSTGHVSHIRWVDPTSFGAWFRRIQGQRTSAVSVLAANCLSYLDLSGCVLDIGDFYNVNFSYANMRGITANYTCFTASDFHHADCQGAYFHDADLRELYGVGANFNNADFRGSRLPSGNLEGAMFVGARLTQLQAKRVKKAGGDISEYKVVREEEELRVKRSGVARTTPLPS